MKKNSSFVLSPLVISCVALFVSCTKDASRALDFQSTDSTIPVGDALQTLSQFIQNTGTRAESRQVQSVDVTRDGDGHPLAYLVNFSSGKGFAVLAADSRIDSIVAVTDSGSADWESIMNAGSKRLDNTSPDFPETLIAKLIKNGISIPQDRGGGGQAGGGLDIGDDNPSGGGGCDPIIIPSLLDTLFNFGQQRTYCHKNNGEFITCGCSATALAIVLAYNHFPQQLYVDTELLDYEMRNAYDGEGIRYRVAWEDIYLQLSDYYYDYACIPEFDLLSEGTKQELLSRIHDDIYYDQGYPDIYPPQSFKRTQFKLCAAMCDTISCIIRGWNATGALPGCVCNGLTDMGYSSADYWTHSSLNSAHIDTISSMLSHNKPVVMGGWSLLGLPHSHYWIVDGINKTHSSCLIHCNWGWNGFQNGWFSKNCINPNVGVPYDAGGTVNGTDSTSTWNHMIVYRYDIPDSTVVKHVHPVNPGRKSYFYN